MCTQSVKVNPILSFILALALTAGSALAQTTALCPNKDLSYPVSGIGGPNPYRPFPCNQMASCITSAQNDCLAQVPSLTDQAKAQTDCGNFCNSQNVSGCSVGSVLSSYNSCGVEPIASFAQILPLTCNWVIWPYIGNGVPYGTYSPAPAGATPVIVNLFSTTNLNVTILAPNGLSGNFINMNHAQFECELAGKRVFTCQCGPEGT